MRFATSFQADGIKGDLPFSLREVCCLCVTIGRWTGQPPLDIYLPSSNDLQSRRVAQHPGYLVHLRLCSPPVYAHHRTPVILRQIDVIMIQIDGEVEPDK